MCAKTKIFRKFIYDNSPLIIKAIFDDSDLKLSDLHKICELEALF